MKDVILSIYLSICLSICPSVGPSLSLLKLGPIQHNSTLPYPPLSLPYTASIPIEIGPKRLRAETTHLLRPKRPTPKIGRNDPGRNDPGPKRPGFPVRRLLKKGCEFLGFFTKGVRILRKF